MALANMDDFVASLKQKLPWTKTVARATVANTWYSLFDIAGQPGAGTLSAGNTANGIVPRSVDAGYPTFASFGSTAGYLSKIEYGNTVACRIAAFDRLFVAGAFAFNVNTSLTSQPSFASRIPDANYNSLELWAEQVTAGTNSQVVTCNYINQAGVGGKTTPATGTGVSNGIGRCWQLPFAAGDSGIQTLQSITGSTATAGTFNMMILRPLWSARVPAINFGDVHDMLRTGLPRIYDLTALYVLVNADSTSTGVPEMSFGSASN